MALQTGLPTVLVRKEAKQYGTAKLAEGPDVDGKRVLIIEDVITTGGQVVLSTNALRELGAQIETTLCVIDREQGGTENLAEVGLALDALFTRSVLEDS